MTFNEFSKKMTYAMFEEDKRGSAEVDVDLLQMKYGINGPQHWVTDWLESSGHIRWSTRDSGHGTVERVGTINGHGRSWVENNANPMLLATALIQPVETATLPSFPGVAATALDPSPFDSAAWTGVTERVDADPAIVTRIAEKIIELDGLVEKANLNNSDTARAKAITQSLKLLISSPQPEWRAIVALLNSPFLTAIVNVLAVTEFSLKILFGIS